MHIRFFDLPETHQTKFLQSSALLSAVRTLDRLHGRLCSRGEVVFLQGLCETTDNHKCTTLRGALSLSMTAGIGVVCELQSQIILGDLS